MRQLNKQMQVIFQLLIVKKIHEPIMKLAYGLKRLVMSATS